MLHKIIRQAQDSLSSYATQISSQLDYLADMAQQDKTNLPYMDSKAWIEASGVLCIKNNHSVITGYKVKELWSVFLVDIGKVKSQKELLREIKNESLEALALGSEHFLLSTSPKDSHSYTLLIEDEPWGNSKQFKIENWSGDLRKTEHFMFELNDMCENVMRETNQRPHYPSDIMAHDYQMKSASAGYCPTKLSFYTNAFMEIGTGYQWNKDGNLCYPGVKYQPEIDNIDSQTIELGDIDYLPHYFQKNNLLNYPSNISPEWAQARLVFIGAMKDFVSDFDNKTQEQQQNFLQTGTLQDITAFIEKCESPQSKKFKP